VICDALGITRVETMLEGTLGDNAEYAHSAGWVERDGYVENIGTEEQQIYISDLYTAGDFYVEVELGCWGMNASDAYPKTGLAIKSKDKTLFFYLDSAGFNNSTTNGGKNGNIVIRLNQADWGWSSQLGAVYMGDTEYAKSYKTLAILKADNTYYFIADGEILATHENLFGESDLLAVSVMTFNMNVRIRSVDSFVPTPEQITEIITPKEVAPTLDGHGTALDAEQMTNVYSTTVDAGTRSFSVVAYLTADGVWIHAEATATSAIGFNRNNSEWWRNPNFEIVVNGRTIQAYVYNSAWNVSLKKWAGGFLGEDGLTMGIDIFVTRAMVGLSERDTEFQFRIGSNSVVTEAAFVGILWDNNYRWVSENGISATNNAPNVTQANFNEDNKYTIIIDDRTFTINAYIADGGVYLYIEAVTTSEINYASNLGNWYENPNFEFRINDSAQIKMYVKNNVFYCDAVIASHSEVMETNKFAVTLFVPLTHKGLGTDTNSVQIWVGCRAVGVASDNFKWVINSSTPITVDENGIV